MLVTRCIPIAPGFRFVLRHCTENKNCSRKILQVLPCRPTLRSLLFRSLNTSSAAPKCQKRSGSGFNGFDDQYSNRPRDTRYEYMEGEKRRHYNRNEYDNRRGLPPDGNKDPPEDKRSGFTAFLKRFVKNLFLLTGGVIWCGSLIYLLFADDMEIALEVSDPDEEVRVMALLDVPYEKDGVPPSSVRSKDTIPIVYNKLLALHSAIDLIKENQVMKYRLGTPLQLTGYRVAGKLSRLMEKFQNMPEAELEKFLMGSNPGQRSWAAECLLEGPKGLASLQLEFAREMNKNDWVLTRALVHVLVNESGEPLLELDYPLLEG